MSKLKRFLRDGLILAVIGVGLYFLTTGTKMIKGESVDRVSDFSPDRQMADRLLAKKRFAEALPFLEKVTEEDRYNSYAWYWMGHCAFQLSESHRDQLAGLQESDDKYDVHLKAYNDYINQSANSFSMVLTYPRLRNRARYNLAVIHVILDDREKSLGYLRDAVDDGYYTKRGLNRYSRFEALKGDDEFISICRQEHRNYMKNVNTSGRPRVNAF